MEQKSTYASKIEKIDRDYIQPTSEFIQDSMFQAGKKLLIRPVQRILSEVAKAVSDFGFDAVENIHLRYDQLRVAAADRLAKRRIREGIRELNDVMVKMATDLNSPLSPDDIANLYTRILLLDSMAKALDVLDDTQNLPKHFQNLLDFANIPTKGGYAKSLSSEVIEIDLVENPTLTKSERVESPPHRSVLPQAHTLLSKPKFIYDWVLLALHVCLDQDSCEAAEEHRICAVANRSLSCNYVVEQVRRGLHRSEKKQFANQIRPNIWAITPQGKNYCKQFLE